MQPARNGRPGYYRMYGTVRAKTDRQGRASLSQRTHMPVNEMDAINPYVTRGKASPAGQCSLL